VVRSLFVTIPWVPQCMYQIVAGWEDANDALEEALGFPPATVGKNAPPPLSRNIVRLNNALLDPVPQ